MHVLVLGAGQLARMMALAGAPLNLKISAYDVNSDNIVHPLTQVVISKGLTSIIDDVDVITAEFEHIPHPILDVCEQSGKFLPTPDAIKIGGDRRLEKKLLDTANVRNAKYHIINDQASFQQAIADVEIPMVLKTALGGYDGKGQWRLTDTSQIDTVWQELEQALTSTPNQAIVAEAFVPFNREVSLVGARGKDGQIKVYPLAENIHTDGVLSLSTAIDEPQLQTQAQAMFTAIADQLDYVGVLAIEFFDVAGELLVNEIAPRVHNSGHWTQQGAETCQFENHLRAVCGLPLGDTAMIRPTAMINILGEDSVPNSVIAHTGSHVHFYGKDKRPGRKMGHINVCATATVTLTEQLALLATQLDAKAYPALQKIIQS